MRELALHILDIAENSIEADAGMVEISVIESTAQDRLAICVTDDGKGMDAETVARVIDPFVTHRTTRKVGLGIPLLKEAAEACHGSLAIQSAPGQGTRLTVDFQRSHIDRMPLGDLAATFITLLISHPQTHWKFYYQVDDNAFDFDDAPIKNELGDIPLTEPAVLSYLKNVLTDGVTQAQAAVPQI